MVGPFWQSCATVSAVATAITLTEQMRKLKPR